jgi:hypothetical protein
MEWRSLMTRLERNRLHTTSRDFFDMHGHTLMKLNVDAADGLDPPVDQPTAHHNNLEAAEFIAEERQVQTAFVVTAPPISGWPHKSSAGRADSHD